MTGARRLPDEAAQAIREAGFFRICPSIENGGYGLSTSMASMKQRVLRAEIAPGIAEQEIAPCH
jgi:hypothetical protein